MIERFKERKALMRPLWVPLILYIGCLTVSAFWQEVLSGSPWRYGVALVPLLPGIWLAAGVVGVVRRLDELSRRVIIESAAVTFAATILLVLSLSLLSLTDLPMPNPAYILIFMGAVLFIAKLVISRKYQ